MTFGQRIGGYGGMGGAMNPMHMTPKMFDNMNLDDIYGMDFEDMLRYGLMGMNGGAQGTGGQSGGYGSPYGYGINNLFRNVGQMAANYPGGFAKLYDDLNLDDIIEKGFYGAGYGGMGMGGGAMGGGMGSGSAYRYRKL